MKILAAVDLSKASSYIIEAVHRVAMATDSEVVVMFVEPPLPTTPGLEYSPAAIETGTTDTAMLEELVGQLNDLGVKATAEVRNGRPARVIVDEARRTGAELIVVGSHGHGLLFDALVGSVSAEILRHSPIPTLVVPIRGL